MTLQRGMRVLLARWYVTIPGLLMSLAMAGIVLILVPPMYTSSGVAILVQAKQVGANATNPLLNFDASLSTTSSILVQSLSSPGLANQINRSSGDSFTVKNSSSNGNDPGSQPFIYVTTQSPTAEQSVEMVDLVLGFARQDLLDRQQGLRVLPGRYIKLVNVVSGTPPRRVLGRQLVAPGAVAILSIVVTIAVALLGETLAAARRQRSASQSAEERFADKAAGWSYPITGSATVVGSRHSIASNGAAKQIGPGAGTSSGH